MQATSISQEHTDFEKSGYLFGNFFRQHQATVTRCDANVILGTGKHCFRHGYRAIARPVKCCNQSAEAGRHRPGDDANLVSPGNTGCPVARGASGDPVRNGFAEYGLAPVVPAEIDRRTRAAER